MNAAALQGWTPVLFNLLVAAFIYGGLYTQVKNSKKDIENLQAEQVRQWEQINRTERDVAGIRGSIACPAAKAHTAHA